MVKWFLYACEQTYGGLHGIDTWCIDEFDESWSKEEIYSEYIVNMSFEVMDSYGNIMDSIYESVDMYEDDYVDEVEREEAIYEEMLQNVDGYCAKIKDEYQHMTIKELEKEISKLGTDWFTDKYCEEVY